MEIQDSEAPGIDLTFEIECAMYDALRETISGAIDQEQRRSKTGFIIPKEHMLSNLLCYNLYMLEETGAISCGPNGQLYLCGSWLMRPLLSDGQMIPTMDLIRKKVDSSNIVFCPSVDGMTMRRELWKQENGGQSYGLESTQRLDTFNDDLRKNGPTIPRPPIAPPFGAGGPPHRMPPPEMPPNGFPPNGMPPQGFPPNGTPPQGFPPNGMPPQGFPPNGAPPQGFPPNGAPPQGFPPNGAPPQGFPPNGMPPQGFPPNGMPPQGFPPNGAPPQGFAPNGAPPQGFPPNGMPPHGFAPNGAPPQGFPPNGMPPQGFPPNGMPPQGFAPNGVPPQDFPPNGAPPPLEMPPRGIPSGTRG